MRRYAGAPDYCRRCRSKHLRKLYPVKWRGIQIMAVCKECLDDIEGGAPIGVRGR